MFSTAGCFAELAAARCFLDKWLGAFWEVHIAVIRPAAKTQLLGRDYQTTGFQVDLVHQQPEAETSLLGYCTRWLGGT